MKRLDERQVLRARELYLEGKNSIQIHRALKEEFGAAARRPRSIQNWIERQRWEELRDEVALQGLYQAIESERVQEEQEVDFEEISQEEMKELTEGNAEEEVQPEESSELPVKREFMVLDKRPDAKEKEEVRIRKKKITKEQIETLKNRLAKKQEEQYKESESLRTTAYGLIQTIVLEMDKQGIPILDSSGNGKLDRRFDSRRLQAAVALFKAASDDCRKLEELLCIKSADTSSDGFADEGMALLWRRTEEALEFAAMQVTRSST